jgi:hypothetical protein
VYRIVLKGLTSGITVSFNPSFYNKRRPPLLKLGNGRKPHKTLTNHSQKAWQP